MKVVAYVLVAAAIVVFLGFIYGIGVFFLWNWLMPIIFHLPTITFWQAIGLSVLTSLLFRSSGGSSSSK